MSKVSKVSQVSNTLLNKRSKAMSKVSKVVFAAFMRHCTQSNVTYVRDAESELCIQGLSPFKEGRLFEKLSVMWV